MYHLVFVSRSSAISVEGNIIHDIEMGRGSLYMLLTQNITSCNSK